MGRGGRSGLKQWSDGVTSEPRLWAFRSKWTISPFEERSWSHYSSHPRVIRPFPVLSGHTGRLDEARRGCHRRALLSFPFLSFPLTALLSAFPASSQLSSQKQSHSCAAFSCQQPYTSWTLRALSNPRPVLSQLWNNSHSTSTTGNHRLQENNPHPTGLLDPQEPTT